MSNPLILGEVKINDAAEYIKRTAQAERMLGWSISPWLKVFFYSSMIAAISLIFSNGIERHVGGFNVNAVIASLYVICIGLLVEVSLMRLQLTALIEKHHLEREKSEIFKDFLDQGK